MTVRELLETCQIEFNEIELRQKGKTLFDGYEDRLNEIQKGYQVKRWEPYEAEWSAAFKFNLFIEVE